MLQVLGSRRSDRYQAVTTVLLGNVVCGSEGRYLGSWVLENLVSGESSVESAGQRYPIDDGAARFRSTFFVVTKLPDIGHAWENAKAAKAVSAQ